MKKLIFLIFASIFLLSTVSAIDTLIFSNNTYLTITYLTPSYGYVQNFTFSTPINVSYINLSAVGGTAGATAVGILMNFTDGTTYQANTSLGVDGAYKNISFVSSNRSKYLNGYKILLSNPSTFSNPTVLGSMMYGENVPVSISLSPTNYVTNTQILTNHTYIFMSEQGWVGQQVFIQQNITNVTVMVRDGPYSYSQNVRIALNYSNGTNYVFSDMAIPNDGDYHNFTFNNPYLAQKVIGYAVYSYNAGGDFNTLWYSEAYASRPYFITNVSAFNYSYSGSVVSCSYSINGGVTNTTITCGQNVTNLNSVEGLNSLNLYMNNSIGTVYSDTIYYFKDSLSFGNSLSNATSIDMISSELLRINVTYNSTYNSINSAEIYYGSNIYNASISGGVMNTSVPLAPGNFSYYWKFNVSSSLLVPSITIISSNYSLNVANLTLDKCNATLTNKFINITFKNQTVAQERIAATLYGTLQYYITPSITKTLTYSNLTYNTEYDFCSNAEYRTLTVTPSLSFYNQYSTVNSYSTPFTATNGTKNLTFYLTPNSVGLLNIIQVVSPSSSPIVGATVNVSHATYGLVGSSTTDSTGGVSFFLDYTQQYLVCGSATNYISACYTITPNYGTYQLRLGSSVSQNYNSCDRGIDYDILPSNLSLSNNTFYTFSFNVSSNYYSLDGYGLEIFNSSGASLGIATGSTSGGGIVSLMLTTNNSKYMKGIYYWESECGLKNMTKTWVVISSEGNQYSVSHALGRLRGYVNDESDSDGLFGLTNNNGSGSLAFIMFFVVFIGTGLVTYRYGVTSPGAITTVMFMLLFLVDVVFNLMPIGSGRFAHVPTIFMALVAVLMVAREEMT